MSLVEGLYGQLEGLIGGYQVTGSLVDLLFEFLLSFPSFGLLNDQFLILLDEGAENEKIKYRKNQ